MANPSMFPFPIVFSICLSSFTLQRTSSLVIFIKPADLFHSSPHHTSKASNLLSVCVNVHVSAAFSATLQTKHFIILFFSFRFILPVKNFFSSMNTFFTISIVLRISFVHGDQSSIRHATPAYVLVPLKDVI